MTRTALMLCTAAFISWLVTPAAAAPFTLLDENSEVVIDPDPGLGDDGGVTDWLVDGTDHLFRQWFWYRVGPGGPEAPIDTLGAPTVLTLSTDGELDDDAAFISYAGPGFAIEVLYVLTGGTFGSNTSDLAEIIRIRNTGVAPLDFHFFQYSDFDLNETIGDDVVEILNPNTVSVSDPELIISETVVIPTPSHHQIDTFPSLVDLLDDGLPTTLDDSIGPLGPTDAEWGFQWDFVLPVNGSFIISKDKHIQRVPEPSTFVLLGIGAVGFAWLSRSRRNRG